MHYKYYKNIKFGIGPNLTQIKSRLKNFKSNSIQELKMIIYTTQMLGWVRAG